MYALNFTVLRIKDIPGLNLGSEAGYIKSLFSSVPADTVPWNGVTSLTN